MPTSILLGRCIDIWADDPSDLSPLGRPVPMITSTKRNHDAAADHLGQPRRWQSPWRADTRTDALAELGLDLSHLPALRAEALQLLRLTGAPR